MSEQMVLWRADCKHKWDRSVMKCGHVWRRCRLCWAGEYCEHGRRP